MDVADELYQRTRLIQLMYSLGKRVAGFDIGFIFKDFSEYINNKQTTYGFSLNFGDLNKNMKIILENLINKKNVIGLVNKVGEFFEQFAGELNKYNIKIPMIDVNIRTNDPR